MKKLYFANIYPHLIYALPVWGTTDQNKTYMQALQRTQKKIVRIIYRKPPQTPTTPLMEKLKILNIPNLCVLRTAINMHPYLHPKSNDAAKGCTPLNTHEYTAISEIHSYPTRFSAKAQLYISNDCQYKPNYIPKVKTTHFGNKFAQTWNSLPREITNINQLDIFKKELATYLLAQQSA